MAIFMKDKCLKVKCKGKVNTYGQTKMYMKELLLQIKCVEMES